MKDTSIKSYDYNLPIEQIAKKPLNDRECSKLLHIDLANKKTNERHFSNLLEILSKGDLLILNNTRVIPARIYMMKDTGGKIEILFHKKLTNKKCEVIFSSSRSPKINSSLKINGNSVFQILEIKGNTLILECKSSDNIFEIFEKHGEVPLPKYIKRPVTDDDKDQYQTVYAKLNGSVAAPTAGLHFTDQMIDELINKGITIKFVTLHISYNTFKPISCDSFIDHDIGSEYIKINEDLFTIIEKTKKSGKRIIAVGTTVMRAIEFCYTKNIKESYEGPADLFIYPGYKFKAINCMITNFHLPKSSLLLLVCAFAGKDIILQAYNFAVKKKYRFYSFGDSMFLENNI